MASATSDRSSSTAILADTDVVVTGAIGPYTEGLSGRAATPDLEVLFQLVHLLHDPAAGRSGRRSTTWPARTGRSSRIPASDPGLSPASSRSTRNGTATSRACSTSRRRRTSRRSTRQVSSACGATGSATPATGCSRSRATSTRTSSSISPAGTSARCPRPVVPSTGSTSSRHRRPGIVERTVEAGTGAQGALNVLYTVPVESIDPSDVAAAAVVTQLLSTRLTDDIREVLGESYSPFATVAIYGDPDPVVETYVSVTGAPDRIGAIASSCRTTSRALRADGPSQDEFDTAVEQVSRDIELFSDAQLVDEILEAEVNGVVDLEDFADQDVALQELTIDDVRRFVAAYLPVDQYIQITRVAALTRHEETYGDLAGIGVPVGCHVRWQRHELRALQRVGGARRAVPVRRRPSRDADRAAGRRRLRLALLPAAGAARPALRLSGPRSVRRQPRVSGRTRTSCCSTRTPRRRSARSTGIPRCSRTSSAIRPRSTTTTPPRT